MMNNHPQMPGGNLTVEEQQKQVQMLMQQQLAMLTQWNQQQQHQSQQSHPGAPPTFVMNQPPPQNYMNHGNHYGYPMMQPVYPSVGAYGMPPSPPHYPRPAPVFNGQPPRMPYPRPAAPFHHQNAPAYNHHHQQQQFNQGFNRPMHYPPSAPRYPQKPPAPKPPQIPVSCEPCQKTFDNQKMLDAHLKQHVTCPHCPFSAAKRLVVEHERTAHPEQASQFQSASAANSKEDDDEVYKPFVVRIETPEEIERWRAARRKNYPTADNVAKKTEEEEERKRRMGLKTYKLVKRKQTEALMNTFRKTDDQKSKKRKHESTTVDSVTEECQEATASSDDEKPPEEASTSLAQHDARKERLCKYFIRGTCRAGNQCPFKHALPPKIVKEVDVVKKQSEINSNAVSAATGQRFRHGNLTKMLLEDEIEKERWTVYQAAHFLLSKCLKEPGFVSSDNESESNEESDSDSSSSSESSSDENDSAQSENDDAESSVANDSDAPNSDDEGSEDGEIA